MFKLAFDASHEGAKLSVGQERRTREFTTGNGAVAARQPQGTGWCSGILQPADSVAPRAEAVKLGKSTELRWKLQNRSAAGMRAIWLEICGEAILEFGWFTTRDQSSSMRMTEGGRLAVVRPASTRTRHSSASAKSRPFLQFFQEVRRITFFTSVKDGVMMLPFFRKSKGITAI